MNRKELHEWIDDLYNEYHLGEKSDPDFDYVLYTADDLLQQDEKKAATFNIILCLKKIFDDDFDHSDYLSPHSFIMRLEKDIEDEARLLEYDKYVLAGYLEYTQEALNAGIKIL